MNKTIFITGAAKRIGKDIALTFSDLGWNIIIHYNSSKQEADELAAQINSKNPDSAKIVQGNLDIADDVKRILNGIDINLKTNFPKTAPHTPLDFALEKSHQTTVNLIRKHGGKTAEELKAEGK